MRIISSIHTLEGAGFEVRRPFPTRIVDHIDPFLLVDEMGPSDVAPGEARGAPDHPHRGFETVTYVLSGEMQHEDSAGHKGKIGPGDVQWMTAGAGVVHSETPGEEILRCGGRMHGFQVWVNLPKRDKMMRPRYQELPSGKIPIAEKDGVWARVVAGEALGVSAAIKTQTPIVYVHFRLQPGAEMRQAVPKTFNAFAYVFSGRGVFGDEAMKAGEGDAVVFSRDGDGIFARNEGDAALEFLLLGGEPLGEPVARYGPFVMTTREELVQAVEDFQSGKMGKITRSAEVCHLY